MTTKNGIAVLPPAERAGLATVLANITRGDAALCRDLIDRLREAMAGDLAGLSHTAAVEDWLAAGRHVHRIKGSGGLTQCFALVAAAEHLEQALRRERIATIRRRLTAFVALAGDLHGELHRLAASFNSPFNESERIIHSAHVQETDCAGTLSVCTGY
ncbi:Hpt domain-containing protein [Cupriavidus pampae]|uniref:HPt domain-containing protein n=1 Tax=Cupriavidus pampae TaxID=659251 RepID=A0ABM8XPW1_9BURK|nr:Hpt domain-containing protein [Cupriavidus pampae]CAG9182312.1 hypothetical protein LMG32289_05089 [Cupriavidus pampae]